MSDPYRNNRDGNDMEDADEMKKCAAKTSSSTSSTIATTTLLEEEKSRIAYPKIVQKQRGSTTTTMKKAAAATTTASSTNTDGLVGGGVAGAAASNHNDDAVLVVGLKKKAGSTTTAATTTGLVGIDVGGTSGHDAAVVGSGEGGSAIIARNEKSVIVSSSCQAPSTTIEKPSYLSYVESGYFSRPEPGSAAPFQRAAAVEEKTSTPTPTQASWLYPSGHDPFEEIAPLPPVLHQNNNIRSRGPGAYAIGGGRRRAGGIRPPDQQESPSLPELEEQLDDNNNNNNDHDDLLAEALPVASEEFRIGTMMEAQPVDKDRLDQLQAVKEAKERRYKLLVCCLVVVVVAFLALILSLSFGGGQQQQQQQSGETSPTPSPSRPLLPTMENLELLYYDLPENTMESLYDSDSAQYRAWEWLLNHPYVSIMQEWRKKQIFAMATIYYSLWGPNWPETFLGRHRWMDVTNATSECDWVLSDLEVTHFARVADDVFGPVPSYDVEFIRPCNDHGQLQTLFLHQLHLPNTNSIDDEPPMMPPEIGLLTSLRIIAIVSSQIGGKLSDILVPELAGLQNLLQVSLSDSGVSGTIPTMIGMLTGLRHLIIADNQVTGSVPSEIGGMTSLEYLNLGEVKGIAGMLPSELGLLTRLTDLEIQRSSITGTIPTELGSLSQLRRLSLECGAIPSELGLMSMMKALYLDSNALTGSIPSEMGLMTDVVDFVLGNHPKEQGSSMQGHQNDLTGYLPQELWKFSHLNWLFLSNLPSLHGRVPTEIMMPNLTKLSLSGSPYLSGTIPEQACMFVDELEFDCSDALCGCDCWCSGSSNKTNRRA